MNILFFLTPKNEVEYIFDDFTVRQTMEKMEYHKYSEIPIITRSGLYHGSITEGDILWMIKECYDLSLCDAENIPVQKVRRKRQAKPVSINANIEDLIEMSLNQNFVPVTDDEGIFIGIVKRKDIINYCYGKMKQEN